MELAEVVVTGRVAPLVPTSREITVVKFGSDRVNDVSEVWWYGSGSSK